MHEVHFQPISASKNVLTVTVRNLTDRPQVFVVHIQTRASAQGPGWGTQFAEPLAPAEEKTVRFGYAFSAPPGTDGAVRVRGYNPPSAELPEDLPFFYETTRSVAEIGLASPDTRPLSPASPEVTQAVQAQFARFQQALREKQYATAWDLFTRTHRQAAFQGRGEGRFSFATRMETEVNPSPECWDRRDILQLQPGPVQTRGESALLTAKLGEAAWTVEFAQEGGEWRVDWINGRPPLPRDRNARIEALCQRLEKRTTPHFDICYATDSPAARDMDTIAAQRESGYQAIREFTGATQEPRIRLIFFADPEAKSAWIFHHGAGYADGTTLVEIYNEETKLDPYHETAHALSPPGNPPAVFAEGFGTYMSERLGAPPLKALGGGELSLYTRARELKEKGQWIPLERLLTLSEIGSDESQPEVAYPEAGACVKFLVDTYGREKFLQAYSALRNPEAAGTPEENRAALERTYGLSLAELDRGWPKAMGLPKVATPHAAKEARNMPSFVGPADPPSASYVIAVRLAPEQKRLSGTETIRLVNRTRLSLPVLALTWGFAREGSYTVKIGQATLALSACGEGGPMLVQLPSPLAPGQTVELSVAFTAPLSSQVYGAWPLVRFHPKLYWEHPTLDDYEVQIDAPAGWAIAVGARQGADRVWRAKRILAFGALASPEYQVMETTVGDTLIRAYYRPAGKECADLLLATAADAVTYYCSQFGFYPFPFLTIVPGMDQINGGGPLAAGLVAIHGEERFAEGKPDHFRWITSHEIGHQYWGECVADDDNPDWLWIGLGIYMDREYTRARKLNQNHRAYFLGRYLEGVSQGVNTTIARPAEEIERADFDYNNIVMHGKGFAVISALESVLGKETFRRVYQQCLDQYRGKRLGAVEFQRFCEATTGQDLNWFFSQWVHSNRQLAYKISSTAGEREGDRYRSAVTVACTGSLEMPITVEARFEDGSRQRVMTDRLAAKSELHFDSAAPLKEAVLDPDGALPLREEPVTKLAEELAHLDWSGNGEKAHTLFPRAKAEGVDSAKTWFKLGLNLFDGGFYAEALEAFRKLKALAPDDGARALALVWCGHLLDMEQKREEALACYREAKRLGLSGTTRHDQFHMVIDSKWIEARLKTRFVWPAK